MFNWPYAAVDTRIRLRCPYSVNEDDVRYAEWSCRLIDGYPETSNDSAWWLGSPMTDECPDPPFVETLSDVSDEMVRLINRISTFQFFITFILIAFIYCLIIVYRQR